ncbi:hypothetical protein M422DRAFT_237452 [Sphaerobolus stellatus SS14]|uniref:Uncharacterized protein n=1 Tax=Sphaerobolus stellatus (strain SS14) TaxID=990650 RepID=A0A0C9U588_SPHS4|nr:hypothetical protein M422DRAFT_237452 [Sphaerobolus stellatus SS14]
MWVGHFASGLIAKPFTPNTPLWVLTFAGAFPDALHFVLNFINIESFNFDPTLAKRGCFPYSNDYAWSHSAVGMIVAGLAYVAIYSALTDRKVTFKDQAILFATVFSHFFLELPVHRPGKSLNNPSRNVLTAPTDVKITPNDDIALGASLFDHRFITFLLETTLVWVSFMVFNKMTPISAKGGVMRNPNLSNYLLAMLVAEQAFFCWGSAPTTNSKYIHAPMFLGQILFTCFMLGKLD